MSKIPSSFKASPSPRHANNDQPTKISTALSSSFSGMANFLACVLHPTLGAKRFEATQTELLQIDADLQRRANQAHILAIHHVGNYAISGTLKVYEIVIDDQANMRRMRVGIQQIVRSALCCANERALIVVRYQHPKDRSWRFSFAESIATSQGESLFKRSTYLFGPDYCVHSAVQAFCKLAAKRDVQIDDVRALFSVRGIIKSFYTKLYRWYKWAQSPAFNVTFPNPSSRKAPDRTNLNEHLIRLITLVIFAWFIKQKDMVASALFEPGEIGKCLCNFDPLAGQKTEDCKSTNETASNYYRAILYNLFFETIDHKTNDRTIRHTELFTDYGKATLPDLFARTPYLNTNLFAELEPSRLSKVQAAKRAFLPNILFFNEEEKQPGLLTLLKQYNFAAEESTADDTVVALDPEVLGSIFENLLASITPETQGTARKSTGSFYTPREVVRYMVETSLAEYLKTRLHASSGLKKVAPTLIDRLIHEETCPDELNAKQRAKLSSLLLEARILDPACGSGAFPMGIMQCILELIQKLDPSSANDLYLYKKSIIENCIYGVDIQPIAVQISKLRCFMSLLVEQTTDETQDNRGISPVPDLAQRFVAANALVPKPTSQATSPKQAINLASDHFDPAKMMNIVDGFDIVIGNPPYGVKLQKAEKQYYHEIYEYLFKRFDIYMVFFELGLRLSKDVVCYITPDKWLSKSFGQLFRERCMIPYMKSVLHLGNAIFDSATVDAIISLFQKRVSSSLAILTSDAHNQFKVVNTIDKTELQSPYLIDEYFIAEKPGIIQQLEALPHRLSEFAKCEYASASPSDAYKLKALLKEDPKPAQDAIKVINTGSIGKYHNRWSERAMKYLKSDYSQPVVDRTELSTQLGPRYVTHASSPKLLIKGLNLLDASIDFDGRYMSTVATLNMRIESRDLLVVVAAIVNSSAVTAYLKARHKSSSYCGGLLFTPEMINQIPVPDLSDLAQWHEIIEGVNQIMTLDEPLRTAMIAHVDELTCRLLFDHP